MKQLSLTLMLLYLLLPSTTFSGTFYNPSPEELKKEGQQAAEKLNESFAYFYQMLRYVEADNYGSAIENKAAFESFLEKDVSPLFKKLSEKASGDKITFNLTDQIKFNKEKLEKRFYGGKEITTKKDLTELSLQMIGLLSEESRKVALNQGSQSLYPALRGLIITAINVQWVGVQVSELWSVSQQSKATPNSTGHLQN
jgi:hypothetical protein